MMSNRDRIRATRTIIECYGQLIHEVDRLARERGVTGLSEECDLARFLLRVGEMTRRYRGDIPRALRKVGIGITGATLSAVIEHFGEHLHEDHAEYHHLVKLASSQPAVLALLDQVRALNGSILGPAWEEGRDVREQDAHHFDGGELARIGFEPDDDELNDDDETGEAGELDPLAKALSKLLLTGCLAGAAVLIVAIVAAGVALAIWIIRVVS